MNENEMYELGMIVASGGNPGLLIAGGIQIAAGIVGWLNICKQGENVWNKN